MKKAPPSPQKDSLGTLLKLYWDIDRIEAQGGVEELRKNGIPTPDELLPGIYSALPSGTGIRTVVELEHVLQELPNFLGSVSDDPSEMEAEARRFLKPVEYQFRIPIGRATVYGLGGDVGGRMRLRFGTNLIENQPLCTLEGAVEGAHWIIARRIASETTDEMLGLLEAVGLARFAAAWFPEPSYRRALPPLTLQLSAASETEDAWSDEFTLSWTHIHDVWSTAIGLPPDSTELERAEERRTGVGALVERRLDLATRPFRAGGIHGLRIRKAARFLRKSSTAESPGDSYLFMATCLEGLLVAGKNDLSARVSDAAGFLLGRTHDERASVRDMTAHLYDVRSRYVHEGEYAGSEPKRLGCLELTRSVLREELRRLASSDT